MTRQFSAGGAVFQKDGDTVRWLITKRKPSPDFPKERYQLPKGLIEGKESPEITAVREVEEETNVKAKIISKIGYSKYIINFKKTDHFKDSRVFKIVTWYLMEYMSGEAKADNQETDAVMWLTLDETLAKLNSTDKPILQKASDFLNNIVVHGIPRAAK